MKRSAFTLVELLIVMAVIAALISVVAPLGLNALKQARTVQTAADFNAVRQDIYGKVATFGTTTGITWSSFAKQYGKTTFNTPTVSSNMVTVQAASVGNWDYEYLTGALKNTGDYLAYYTSAGGLTFSVEAYLED